MDSNTEDLFLSPETLAALQEFYTEQESKILSASYHDPKNILKINDLEENWQLSQFWYDDFTAEKITQEVLNEIPYTGKIALIACPSLYYFIRKAATNTVDVKLLDIDDRFNLYKNDFMKYDYNNPLPPAIPKEWYKIFDIVILDPPFLSEECLLKCATTAKYLTKDKIILCTGTVMESFAKEILEVTKTTFEPKHTNNLGNEFGCFINYKSKYLVPIAS